MANLIRVNGGGNHPAISKVAWGYMPGGTSKTFTIDDGLYILILSLNYTDANMRAEYGVIDNFRFLVNYFADVTSIAPTISGATLRAYANTSLNTSYILLKVTT